MRIKNWFLSGAPNGYILAETWTIEGKTLCFPLLTCGNNPKEFDRIAKQWFYSCSELFLNWLVVKEVIGTYEDWYMSGMPKGYSILRSDCPLTIFDVPLKYTYDPVQGDKTGLRNFDYCAKYLFYAGRHGSMVSSWKVIADKI